MHVAILQETKQIHRNQTFTALPNNIIISKNLFNVYIETQLVQQLICKQIKTIIYHNVEIEIVHSFV